MAQVSVEYKHVDKALEWAKENCPSYITNQIDMIHLAEKKRIDPIRISFVFDDEKDATLFALRWK